LSIVTLDVPDINPPVKINVAFKYPETVVHLMVSNDSPIKVDINKEVSEVLLEGKHGYDLTMSILNQLKAERLLGIHVAEKDLFMINELKIMCM